MISEEEKKRKKAEYDREYRNRNKKKLQEQKREYHEKNKERVRQNQILLKEKDPIYFKERTNAAGKRYRDKNKEKWWEKQIKYKFKIGAEEYYNMLKKQNGRCAICDSDKPAIKGKQAYFSIDHCHKSNKIRGLLCNECNSGLGFLKDNIEVVSKALEYLRENGE